MCSTAPCTRPRCLELYSGRAGWSASFQRLGCDVWYLDYERKARPVLCHEAAVPRANRCAYPYHMPPTSHLRIYWRSWRQKHLQAEDEGDTAENNVVLKAKGFMLHLSDANATGYRCVCKVMCIYPNTALWLLLFLSFG